MTIKDAAHDALKFASLCSRHQTTFIHYFYINADLPRRNQLLGKKEVDLDISFFMIYLSHIVLKDRLTTLKHIDSSYSGQMCHFFFLDLRGHAWINNCISMSVSLNSFCRLTRLF